MSRAARSCGGPPVGLGSAASPSDVVARVLDPVCGMEVDPGTATENATFTGTTYYFCSTACRSAFERDPATYTAKSVAVPQAVLAGHGQANGSNHMNEAFEAGGGDVAQEATAIDPVCGMTVITATAEYRSFHQGKAYYFCSQRCKETFDRSRRST